MKKPEHLTNDLLVKAIDDELSDSESLLVDSHLSHCEECKRHYSALRGLSLEIQALVDTAGVEPCLDERIQLTQKLQTCQVPSPALHTPKKIMRAFGWGMALAAGLALGIMLAPQRKHVRDTHPRAIVQTRPGSFEVDGESFIALPYSNPDLPLGAPRIVEMQVPVSSLTDAGIVFESISNQASAPDRSVLADVLLGMDGQPLGVHVLGVE
jgi:anti-sigma factor RsiW